MFPITLLPLSRQLDGYRQGERRIGISIRMDEDKRDVERSLHGPHLGYFLPLRHNDLFFAAYMVFAEAILMGTFGLPDFPEGAYGMLFSCCVAIFFSSQFIDMVPTTEPLVPTFARISEASKNGVRRAGSEVWVYGSSAYDRVRKAGSKGWDWVSDVYDRVSSAGNKAWI